MTQHQNDAPTPQGSATVEPTPPDPAGPPAGEGVAEPNSFTLAGPGSDPAAPAVQPATNAPVADASEEPAATATPASPSSGPPVGSGTTGPSPDYDKYGVPTLDFVRDKIEARYTASLGAEELARQTEEAKSFEQRAEERAKAAEAALDQIRRSLREHRQS